MCILFIAVDQHPDFPLLIAANRDEFHKRPTDFAKSWSGSDLIGGQDQQSSGSWLLVNQMGQLASLTNYRDPTLDAFNKKSRGFLVRDFVLNKPTAAQYLAQLKQTANDFTGYNLLYGDWHDLHIYSNINGQNVNLKQGCFALSNAFVDTPWPKAIQGKEQLCQYLQTTKDIDDEALFAILADQSKAPDQCLPQTGVSLDWERQLSSVFIQGQDYGTRCSTLLMVNKQKQMRLVERSFDENATVVNQVEFAVQLPS